MSVAYFPAQTAPPSTMGYWQDPGPHTRSQVVANSCNSARPPKIPGWIVVVRENFPVNKRVS